MRSQRGFTLTELMVVVAIIAILAGLMFGMSPRPYTANAQVVADQMQSTFIYARTRAVSTRRVHKVEIADTSDGQTVEISAADATGMGYSSATTWQLVEIKRIPKSVIIQTVVPTVEAASGASPAADAGPHYLYFKPDGSATKSTVYLTDRASAPRYYRVLIYSATGSSYAREGW